ncbi:MAG: hypothetical protein JHC38_02735, partial [Thiotrichales bacterium]|nr:hypothetical protein [Thiotrichales bacterium]
MAQLSINTGATVSPLQGFPGIAQASSSTDSSFFGALMDGFSVETASAAGAAGAESPSMAEVSNALPEVTQDAQSLLESNGLLVTAQAPASIMPVSPVSTVVTTVATSGQNNLPSATTEDSNQV